MLEKRFRAFVFPVTISLFGLSVGTALALLLLTCALI